MSNDVEIVDQLDHLDTLLHSLYMMAAAIDDRHQLSAFRTIIATAEDDLARVKRMVEGDAVALPDVAARMREAG